MKLRHFSIRDLLWLTALAAVLVSWGIDRSRLQAKLGDWEKHGFYLGPEDEERFNSSVPGESFGGGGF